MAGTRTARGPQSPPARRETSHHQPEQPESRAEPIDVLLASAALGTWRRFVPGRAGLDLAIGLAGRPGTVARRSGQLAAELGRIVLGTSEVAPGRSDRRFADPAWSSNPFLHRLVQAYLATGGTVNALVGDAKLEYSSDLKIKFIADNLVEALSPSNSPLTNPVALRTIVDTGGGNLVRGGVTFLKDMSSPPRIPAMVDTRPYQVGENLAATPGSVVLRTEVFELIQYAPQTPKVLSVPVLIAPPMINKFYAIDLAPGRSLVEYLLQQGVQVFLMSWRNPDARHRDWGMDAYAQSVIDALDGVQRVTRQPRAVLFGACSGGILASMTAAHLAEIGEADRLAALTLVVTVIDQSRAGLAAAIADKRTARLAAAASARRGYLDGRTLAEVFAWLRPGDLIWSYWVNNYLLGNDPPAFDILAWNADVTRMPAKLHRDFLDIGVENQLVKPGAASVLGTPVDLAAIKNDAYVLAGVSDHLCDWRACYATVNLLGGESRFVLSNSGHIAALVNPPGNPKAKFQVAERNPEDATDYLTSADTVDGTWWADYVQWLTDRCGPTVAAPAELGGGGLEPLDDAPGTYVFER